MEDLLRKLWRWKDFQQETINVPVKYYGLSEYFKNKAKRFNINPSSVCMWKVCPPSAWKASGERRLKA
ncbi:DgyrCDS1927 [Dimorphilus gyrociliatus]|uniref:DgyrCDS1927 n=1 Tax=Dimorphilus gyrociliatus TaxID=2664684 RepID=A0A7I8VAQ5_9ANNE|nr:DgyrCDS1927 [Dimorphilus gyrociliatus]